MVYPLVQTSLYLLFRIGISHQNLVCTVRSAHGNSSMKSPQKYRNCDSLVIWAKLILETRVECYQNGYKL